MGFLKRDNLKLGLLLGGLLPLAGIAVFYYWRIYPNEWGSFLAYLKTEKRLLASLTVVCLLLNVGLFTWYVNTRRDQTAKGIFAMSLLYGVASLLVKFFG